MQYRTLDQIEHIAHVRAGAEPGRALSRRERLERWAVALERHSGQLWSIEGVEFGSRCERDAKAAADSPLSVAFADPALRAAGLRGDTIGDAVAFFGLSRGDLHYIVCYCHHERTIEPTVAADRVRAAAQPTMCRASFTAGPAVAGVSVLAVIGLALAVL